MIGQCLSNKNESATVSKSKKFSDLNKALLSSTPADTIAPLLRLFPHSRHPRIERISGFLGESNPSLTLQIEPQEGEVQSPG